MPNNSAQFSVTVERFRKRPKRATGICNDQPKNGVAFSGPISQTEVHGSPIPRTRRKSLSFVSLIQQPMGRFSVVFLFAVLYLSFGRSANAVRDANNKLFVFAGKIQAVDTAARTFMLQTDKQSYVFVVTDQTKIVRNGKAQNFADLKQGQITEVEMQIGPGGKGMAVSVKLGFDSRQLASRDRDYQFRSLFAATAPGGKTISWPELRRLVVHQPAFNLVGSVSGFGPLKPAVLLLSVRPDGRVSNVEILNSTGYYEIDKRTTQWGTKWRFRPNSVVQVRVAIQLVINRPRVHVF
jgi:TonB family protein